MLAPELVDTLAVKDKVRSAGLGADNDVRYTVQFDDPAFQFITPAGVKLTPRQERYLDDWTWAGVAEGNEYGGKFAQELRAVGAANPEVLFLRITLEGRRNQPIFVDDIRPVNIHRAAPYSGTFVNIPPQDGGEASQVIFNLDETIPRAREAVPTDADHTKPGDLFFHKKTLTIKDANQDSIVIKSIATRWAATFDIRIDYRIGNQSKHLIINNQGRPFAVTPLNCTRRSRLVKDRGPIGGRVSYEDIWQLGGIDGIDHISNPGNYESVCLDPSKR